MAYEQGYVGDPRGRETAVEDAEAYEGAPDDLAALDDLGAAFEGMNERQIDQSPINLGSKFSLEEVECMGSCGTAPMIAVNEDYYENLNTEKVEGILESLKNEN